MIARSVRARLLVVVALLLGARLVMAGREPVVTPLPQPLSAIPLELEHWRGADAAPFDAETLKVLGADEYVNRIYRHSAHAPVGLFIGYYAAQREGTAIHSPQNCLPGSGWVPVNHARTTLQGAGGQFPANRYVVEKRGERQLVLYWFDGRGRRVASEYVNKAYLLHDALRRGRTDGALVRIITPITDGEAAADAAAHAFVRALTPQLTRWLP
jgi:EpsI family protein